MTALSQRTAVAASVHQQSVLLPVMLRTANGTVQAQAGSINMLRLGSIEARSLKVVISPALGDMDVLGINFLSQLAGWRVEGRTLILDPNEHAGPAS